MADNVFSLTPLEQFLNEQKQQLPELPPQPEKTVTKPDESPVFDAPNPAKVMKKNGLMPPVDLQPIFDSASARTGVPVNLIAALAQQESNYNAQAVGTPTKWGRAKGMLQYIDPTANSLGINPFDPVQSINAAADQFKERLDKGYSVQEAIASHFGGDDRKQWGPKTAAYVESVMKKAGTIGTQMMGQAKQQSDERASLQAELDAKEPGRYKVLSPDEAARYKKRQNLMENGIGLGDAAAMSGGVNTPSPLTPENQQAYQQQANNLPLPYSNDVRQAVATGNAQQRDRIAGRDQQQLKQWNPTLWDRITGLIPGNKDRATVEMIARERAKELGISVDEFYRQAGGSRPIFNPEGRAPIQATAQAATEIAKQAPDILPAAANTVLRAIRGGDVNAEPGMLDKAIKATDTGPTGYQDPNLEAFQGIGQSLGFSLTNMVGSAIAGAAGSVAGPVAGAGAALGASGTIAYRASKDQFLDTVRQKLDGDSRRLYGRPLTQQEWANAAGEFEGAATKYGMWEAIPEAVSTLIFLKAVSAPLREFKGAAKLGEIAKRAAETQVSEQTTETMTGVGQNRAEIEAGLTKEELTPADVLRKQGLNVALTTGLMHAGGTAAHAAYEATPQGKRKALEADIQREIDQNIANWDGSYPPPQRPAQNPDAQPPEEPQAAPTGAAPQEPAPQAPAPQPEQPTPPQGPLQRAAAAATQTQGADRVTVQTPEGPISGTVESFTNGTNGTWTAQILGDDGTLYKYSDKDGVSISPETPVAPEAPAAAAPVEPAAQQEQSPPQAGGNADEEARLRERGTPPVIEQGAKPATEQAKEQKPEQPPQPPALAPDEVLDPTTGEVVKAKKLEDMSVDELRERLKYIAGQAKNTGGWNKRLIEERRKVEAAINAVTSQAAPEPVKAAEKIAEPKPAPKPEPKQEAKTEQPPAPASTAQASTVPTGKWFGSEARAAGYIDAKGLQDTHVIVPAGNSRFEIHEKAKEAAPVEQPVEMPVVGQEVVIGKGRHQGTITAVDPDKRRVAVKIGDRAELMSIDSFNARVKSAEEAAGQAEPAQQQKPEQPPETKPVTVKKEPGITTIIIDPSAGSKPKPVPKPAPKKQSPKEKAAEAQRKLEEHFRPGNILHNAYWKNHERVLDFKRNGDNWSVTVQNVEKRGDEWVPTGEPRTHMTPPGRGDTIVERAPEPENTEAETAALLAKGEADKQALADRAAAYEKSKSEQQSAALLDDPVEQIFKGLESSKKSTRQAAEDQIAGHPREAQIRYVEDHFFEILNDLDEAGLVKINC